MVFLLLFNKSLYAAFPSPFHDRAFYTHAQELGAYTAQGERKIRINEKDAGTTGD
jgi:hypothetical protein